MTSPLFSGLSIESADAVQSSRQAGTSELDKNPVARELVARARESQDSEQPAIRLSGLSEKDAAKVERLLRAAAAEAGYGVRVRLTAQMTKNNKPTGKQNLIFQTRDAHKRTTPVVKRECPTCHKQITVTMTGENAGTLRTHGPQKNRCAGSGSR